ncbi:MAG: gliding motility-associated ABC transporter substrate-binding protein GldG [Paludibacteraceae bacterium]|nr:gliding motility-associated ABC transporter substrate-binding protein GldG [Paludibacteraceae bacterium]
MRKQTIYILSLLAAVLLANVLARCFVVRLDLTDDRRYSLSDATRRLLRDTDRPVEVTLWLDGELNSGFRRLRTATEELLDEMDVYADIRYRTGNMDSVPQRLAPIVIHERSRRGRTEQTTVYPYATVRYGANMAVVGLLRNTRGLSGEQNLNNSIENLEYAFAEALHALCQPSVPRIAFLEGHGELPERYVADLTDALSPHFRVDRGNPGYDPQALSDYSALIIAAPAEPFSDADKYVIDQYIMRGGRVLWVLDGVRFSRDVLSSDGFTPVIPLELNLTDMLFRYGARVAPALVQDLQCLPVPADVSSDPSHPNYQPVPWTYAPLLLTSQVSPVTRNLGQVSCNFASPVEAVGGDDGIDKQILLATSSASRVTGTPAQVDLGELNPDPALFRYQFIPVAMSLEGRFTSAFRHLGRPDSIRTALPQLTECEQPARQIIIATGSIIRNDVQQGQPLPVGYDRYSGMQFSNRDFLVNSLLWLTDTDGLISLRQKTVALRLLNDERAHRHITAIQAVSILTPLLLLSLTGLIVLLVRRRLYTR